MEMMSENAPGTAGVSPACGLEARAPGSSALRADAGGDAGEPGVTLDRWPHPLTSEGRETRACVVAPGATLADLIAEAVPGVAEDLAVAVNGRAVPRADRDATRLHGGEIVTLRARLRGGGGDSDPLRVVLTLAVVAASIGAPFIAPASWGLVAGGGVTMLGSVVGGAIMLGGTMVVNMLAPPRMPDAPGAAPPPEARYSISGGANRARPDEPLLLVLGTHRLYPDLAARGYTEFAGDDQFLHEAFDFGVGDLRIAEPRIGDTALRDYDDVTANPAGLAGLADGAHIDLVQGAALPLIADDVDTIAGAELVLPDSGETAGWVTRAASARAADLAVDLVARTFRVDDRGDFHEETLTVEIQYRAHGAAADAEWTDAANGAEWTSPVRLANARQEPLRTTRKWRVGSVTRWDVRMRCTTEASDDARRPRAVTWTALRSYQSTLGVSWAARNRAGLRIRASRQLSGRLDRFSVMASQKVPVWRNGAWSAPEATSNPAWIFRAYALGWRRGDMVIAGAGLPAARLDDAAIRAWGAWCDSRDPALKCDYVIDRRMSHADVLQLIAQCGRASPTWQTGRLGVVWEDPADAATAMVTPGNIVAGSMSVEWASGEAAEEIVCRYIEPALDWQWNTVRRAMPRVAAPARSLTLTLPGVTDERQAKVECNLQAARQLYHRRRLAWEMADEGIAIRRGDVVWIGHGMIDGGQAGRCLAVSDDRRTLTLARSIIIGAGDRMLLRLPDGALHDTAVAPPAGTAPGAAVSTAVLTDAAPASAGDPVDLLWRHYAAATPPAKARIVAVEPRGPHRWRFEAIDESRLYHAAATDNLTKALPAARKAAIPRVLSATVTERQLRAGQGFVTEILLSLTVAGDWRTATVTAAVGDGASRPVAHLDGGATDAAWPARGAPGDTLAIVIVPGSSAAPAGRAFAVSHVIGGPTRTYGALAAVTGFAVTFGPGGVRRFAWDAHPRPDVVRYEIRYGVRGAGGAYPVWNAMRVVARPAGPPHETSTPDRAIANARFAIRAIASDGSVGTVATVDVARVPLYAVGARGEDGPAGPPGPAGRMYEFVFAVTANRSGPARNQRPLNAWNYDSPAAVNGLTWRDGAGEVTAAAPFLWMSQRTFPAVANLRAGSVIDATNWTTPTLISRYGERGVKGDTGDDGGGVEYVFARTATAVRPAGRHLPSNSWGFDRPGVATAPHWTLAVPIPRRPARVAVGSRQQLAILTGGETHVPPEWTAEGRADVDVATLNLWTRSAAESGVELWFRTGGAASSPGPDLADSIEEAMSIAVTLGSRTVRIPGPRAAGSATTDGSDPYSWRPSAAVQARIRAMVLAYSLGARNIPVPTVTLRAGLPWYDGAPDLTGSLRWLWRAERATAGAPDPGDAVAANWSSPVIVGHYGEDGPPGTLALWGPKTVTLEVPPGVHGNNTRGNPRDFHLTEPCPELFSFDFGSGDSRYAIEWWRRPPINTAANPIDAPDGQRYYHDLRASALRRSLGRYAVTPPNGALIVTRPNSTTLRAVLSGHPGSISVFAIRGMR